LPHFPFSSPSIFLPFSSILSLFLLISLFAFPYISLHCSHHLNTHHSMNSLLYPYPICPIPLQFLTKHPPSQQPNYTLTHIKVLLLYNPHTSPPSPHPPFLPPSLVPSFKFLSIYFYPKTHYQISYHYS
jgi:hypothetical protein